MDEHSTFLSFQYSITGTFEEQKYNLEEVKWIIGTMKVCFLIDCTHIYEFSPTKRFHTLEEISNLAKALAIVSCSALGRMTANLFFSPQPQLIPVALFQDEYEAKEWLMRYL